MTTKQRAKGVAIVTGAAGGIGSACARLMIEDGWPEVLLCDFDERRLQEIAEPFAKSGARIETLAADITSDTFGDQLLAALGSREVGALVHAAGVSPATADATRVLAVNLDGTYRLIDTVRARMAEGAAAVIIASGVGHIATEPEADAAFDRPLPAGGTAALLHLVTSPYQAYCLSKRGMIALARDGAKAFGARQARLISLCPGFVNTVMIAGDVDPAANEMLRNAPLPRVAEPEEIGSVAVFLCSSAAGFITGADIRVDGGALAAMGI